jgi:hypothetical protein
MPKFPHLHRGDLVALLTQVGGISTMALSFGLSAQIDALAPGWGVKTLAVIGILSFAAGQLARIIGAPTPPKGMASVITPAPAGVATVTLTAAPPH